MTLTTQELCDRLTTLPTPNIGDAMERLGILDARIKSVWPGARVAGPAYTVWTRSGDNAFIHKALAEAAPGDVIVVNGQGDETRALMGDLIGARAKAKGIAGFIIDGAVRDAGGLQELGMPVFARTTNPAGPYKFGPGILGCPIAVGGVSVAQGDLVVGDDDGVVVIPAARAEEILVGAEAVRDDEAHRMASIMTDIKEDNSCVAR